MKQKGYVVILMIILALCFTGCKRPNFGVSINKDLNVEIIAENASKDMAGGAGGLDVAEGQKLYVVPSLKKGESNIKINTFDLGNDASAKELSDAVIGGSDPVLDINISGTEPSEYKIAPGSYGVSAAVLSKANGSVLITVK